MNILSIALFFVYSWGFGFTFTSFTTNSKNFFERNIMRIGIGLGVFVLIGVILNLLNIPLDWKIFLILSLIYPIFTLFKKTEKKPFNLKLTKANVNILIVIIIFFVCLKMYAGGAFQYPYLEDDDPWAHAQGVKYVAEEKTAYAPENFKFHYLDPYPPGYEMLMGILHQTNDSVYWTLKFFNGLILSLAIVFFYFFAKLFTKDRNKALFSAFVLAALPSFFTHFIWAHSFVIMLFFPTMYCLEMIRKDKKWVYPSSILIASILLTQPSQAAKLGVMIFGYFIIKSIYEKKLLKQVFYAQILGVIISFMWWGFKAKDIIAGRVSEEANKAIASGSLLSRASNFITNHFRPDSGTATKAYDFYDFFRVVDPSKGVNINIYVGWGIIISLLLLIALIYIIIKYKENIKKSNSWIAITLFWFLFTFIGVNSMTFNLPVGFIAFRFWFLLSIPVALLSSIGLFYLINISKKIKLPSIIPVIIIIILIASTAGLAKYKHNTASNWPPGAKWTSLEELQGYIWIRENIPDSKTFKYTKPLLIFGFDQNSCEWCEDTIKLRENLLYTDATQLHRWLKSRDYEYLAISGMDTKYSIKEFGENKTQELLPKRMQELQDPALFKIIHQTQGMVLFQVI